MMSLASVFATPAGLAALAAAIPLVLLYIVQPDPPELTLPTTQFLVEEADDGGRNPVLERLRRNLLLITQLLVVIALAVALAAPYVTVAASASTQPTVLVVDASASMATETGDGTRFDQAIAAAEEAVGEPTTVVVAGATTAVPVEDAPPDRAREALASLSVTAAPGDLRGAVARADRLAGDEGRVVVFSDFASGADWRSAVQAARAGGATVTLQQFDGGGTANVGIVDRQFTDRQVVLTVANTGTEPAERTLSLGDRERSLSLEPGDVRTVAFPMPAEPATAELSPGDDFPVDDTAPVGVPEQATLDVLLLTNDPDQPLATALDVVETVDLTVREPPATVTEAYDVVVFGAVEPDRVLGASVEVAQETLADGGGVAIQATEDFESGAHSDLAPVAPRGVTNTSAVAATAARDPTREFDLPAPDHHLAATPDGAVVHAELGDGSPLVATAQPRQGRLLYHGYLPNQTAFSRSYDYPVYWKATTHWLADRQDPATLNRRTGETLTFAEPRPVVTPAGEVTTARLTFAQQGSYETPDRRYGVALLDERESTVTAPAVETVDTTAAESDPTDHERTVDLTPLAVGVVLLGVFGELAFLRFRGDL